MAGMAAEQDDVLSLSDNGGESEFSGFDEADIPKQGDVVNSKPKTRSKTPSKISKKSKSVSSKSQNKSTSGATSSSAAICNSMNTNENSHSTSTHNNAAKGKSVQNASKGKKPVSKNKDSQNKDSLDISSLSQNDIVMLRNLLGISVQRQSSNAMDEEQYQYLFAEDLENLPNVHVEVENEPESDTEVYLEGENPGWSNPPYSAQPLPPRPLADIGNQISAFFDNPPPTAGSQPVEVEVVDDSAWQLPRLKAPQRGEPIASSLASLINTACTAQCETEEIASRYKLPSNCDKLASPLVNPEIWNEIAKKAQTYDKFLRDIQTLLATGLIPVIKLAELLREQISQNNEAKTMLSDAITLLGQAQFNLSLRRRYMIRPNLKKKYSNLCSLNTPVSTFLFGDDIQKEIKKCDTSTTVTNNNQYYQANYYDNSYKPRFGRGRARGRGGPVRGYYGNATNYRGRYQPYPKQANQFRYGYQQQYQGPPRKLRKSATVTNTEDNTA